MEAGPGSRTHQLSRQERTGSGKSPRTWQWKGVIGKEIEGVPSLRCAGKTVSSLLDALYLKHDGLPHGNGSESCEQGHSGDTDVTVVTQEKS